MALSKFWHSGQIHPAKVASAVNANLSDIAYTAGLEPYELEGEFAASERTQRHLRELVEILNRLESRLGSCQMAFAWARSQPLASFGGMTAMQLIQSGYSHNVLAYIDAVDMGAHV